MIFSFVDARLDRTKLGSLKRWIIYGVLGYIFIWLQLLRGNRDSFPVVMALSYISFLVTPKVSHTIIKKQSFLFKLFLISLFLIVTSFLVGSLRVVLAGNNLQYAYNLITSTDVIRFSNIFHGTWSAVLLTPLSAAADHIDNIAPMKWGSDYLDYLLSVPPGFIAEAFGYVRPIGLGVGPANELSFTHGGLHATVVPFTNFRLVGVFLIPAIWTYFVCRFEKRWLGNPTTINLSLMAVLIMIIPHWLWYGEKLLINGLIIMAIFTCLYRISLSFNRN